MMYVGPLLCHPLTSPGLPTMLFAPGPLPMLSITAASVSSTTSVSLFGGAHNDAHEIDVLYSPATLLTSQAQHISIPILAILMTVIVTVVCVAVYPAIHKRHHNCT